MSLLLYYTEVTDARYEIFKLQARVSQLEMYFNQQHPTTFVSNPPPPTYNPCEYFSIPKIAKKLMQIAHYCIVFYFIVYLDKEKQRGHRQEENLYNNYKLIFQELKRHLALFNLEYNST